MLPDSWNILIFAAFSLLLLRIHRVFATGKQLLEVSRLGVVVLIAPWVILICVTVAEASFSEATETQPGRRLLIRTLMGLIIQLVLIFVMSKWDRPEGRLFLGDERQRAETARHYTRLTVFTFFGLILLILLVSYFNYDSGRWPWPRWYR